MGHERTVKLKMALCPVLILALAAVPALVLQATPWPIPIIVRHRPLWSPWNDIRQAEGRIYTARVREIRGTLRRTAVIEALEVLRGDPDPRVFEEPLGRIAGSNDKGSVFLVFEGPYYLVAVYKIRDAGQEKRVPAPGLDAPGIAHFEGQELVEVTKDLVKVQAGEDHLTREHLDILEAFVSGNRSHWYWMIERDVVEFLEQRVNQPGVNELLSKYKARSAR